MYKLMIVDDEPIIIRGLREYVDWEKYNITIAGEAENGMSAIKKALIIQPDIVLCDIKMPVADGIAFAKEMHKMLPCTKIIFLTGYSEQEYMLEAIRNNVFDYIMKPATAEEIIKAVVKARDEIEQNFIQNGRYLKIDNFLSENLKLLQENFVNQLLTTSMSPEKIRDNIETLSLPLQGPRYLFLMMYGYPSNNWMLVQKIQTVFAKFDPVITQIAKTKIVFTILNMDQSYTFDDLAAQYENHFLCSDLVAGAVICSEIMSDINDFKKVFSDSFPAAQKSIWFPKGQFIRAAELSHINSNLSSDISNMKKKLFDTIRGGLPNQISESAEALFQALVNEKMEFPRFIETINQILNTVSILYNNDGNVYIQEDQYNIAEIRKLFLERCKTACPRQHKYGGGQLGRALRYMEKNFSSDISLESMAADLYISPTYLSKILNEKTHLGFYGWLHYFRIQKACELLAETNLYLYEIAEKVGYSSYKIFSKYFLSLTGLTAKEYRDQYQQDSIT
ncbi:MAG: response regulator [Clostridiaceae bacterium]|nr:response regulator [Clostridiaceae bacterium]